MSTILVTGYRGFIGGHLMRVLTAAKQVVIGLDLLDGNDILSCKLPSDVDRVYHLAAQTNAYCEATAADALTNITGSIRVFDRYRHKVVYTSSSMVNYPQSPYAISKAAAEHYARYYGAAIVRLCNIYGDGGHSVVDKFNRSIELTIFGDGQQARTYAHVDDAVDALLSAQPANTTILMGEDLTVNEIAARHPNKPVRHVDPRALDLVDARQIYQGRV